MKIHRRRQSERMRVEGEMGDEENQRDYDTGSVVAATLYRLVST
jgi:hypothetical protein